MTMYPSNRFVRTALAVLTLSVVLTAGKARAQGSEPAASNLQDSVRVYFAQGNAVLKPAYQHNKENLDAVVGKLQTFADDSLLEVRSIRIIASSSPEGSDAGNLKLAQKRAESIRKYIARNHSFLGSQVTLDYKSVDWELFAKLVGEDEAVPDRALVMSDIVSHDLPALKARKKSWNYLMKNIFPGLRSTIIEFGYDLIFPLEVPELEYPVIEMPDLILEDYPYLSTYVPVPERMQPKHRNDFYLKTNGLTWLLLEANLALEWELSHHLSISIPVYYTALNWFSPDTKFRVLGTQPELRWWFKADEFDGPFLGAHFTYGIYNVALPTWEYRYQDANSPAIGGGLNLGYKIRIRKPWDKFGIEFSVGAGYLDLKYETFINAENGRWVQEAVHKPYWGIDHAAVTFTYRFDKSLWK